MNIKKKIMLFIGLSIVSLIAIISIVSRVVFLNKFEQLERENIKKDLKRTVRILDKELYNLSVTTRDYASWDDTYNFIENRNQQFIDGNIIIQTFLELNLDIMIFMHRNGNVVLEKCADLNAKTFKKVDSSIYNYIRAKDQFRNPDLQQGCKGIIKLNSGILLMSTRAILTSESKGPSRGIVVFGKFLSKEMIRKLTDQSLVPVEFSTFESNINLSGFLSETEKEEKYFWDERGKDSISALTYVNDINGAPIGILKIKEKKEIITEGYTSVSFFLSYIIIFSLLFIFLIYYFVSKMFVAQIGKVELENLYQTLFKTTPEAVFLIDYEGTILNLNDEGNILLNVPTDKSPNKIISYVCAQDKAKYFSSVNEVESNGQIKNIEISLQINGWIKIVEFNIAKLKTSGKGKEQYLMVLHDITEKRETEDKIKNDQMFINAVVNSSPGYIYLYDLVLEKNIFFNKSLYGALGYKETELSDRYFGTDTDIIYPEDLVIVTELRKRLLVSNHTDYVEYEVRLKERENDYIWFFAQEKVFTRNTDGRVKQILGHVIDISDRKESEASLREQTYKLSVINEKLENEINQRKWAEEKLLKNKFILDSIGDAVFTLDEEFRITSFNKIAEDLIGIESTDIIGKDCCEMLGFINDNERFRTIIKKREIISGMEMSIITKSKKAVPVNVSTFLLKNPGNHESEMIVTIRDISEIAILRKEIKKDYSIHDIITGSPKIKRILDILPEIALSDSAVLIEGATGTGKELLAKSIHKLSTRKDKPFVVINCGAIPHQLMESELFGFLKGSFTDAKYNKTGKIVAADKGTVFFDEIGELPIDMQVKILRLLENFEVEPIGSSHSIKVNIRVIAATNRTLKEMVKTGSFRDDLFYRLNTIRLYLPALTERKEDIPYLVGNFIEKFNAKFRKNIIEVDSNVMKLFYNYNFPGNIRELEKIIEHAFILCKSRVISLEHLPEDITSRKIQKIKALDEDSADEKKMIMEVLERYQGDKNKVCAELGIHYTTLWRKLKKYNLFEHIKM